MRQRGGWWEGRGLNLGGRLGGLVLFSLPSLVYTSHSFDYIAEQAVDSL